MGQASNSPQSPAKRVIIARIDCRKSGLLPLDICCEDGRRSAENLQYIDDTTPTEEAENAVARLDEAEQLYHPHSFWEAQDVYLQMLVEKVDLKNLFTSVAEPFRIPISNASGWNDLHSRAAMMERFAHGRRRASGACCCTAAISIPAACTSPTSSNRTLPI